jgi:hypothetical protein
MVAGYQCTLLATPVEEALRCTLPVGGLTLIASLSLYERSAFHLLRSALPEERLLFVSFRLWPGLSNEISSAVPNLKLTHPRRLLPLSLTMC